ncbi:HigA family addiction module antidote protein [Subtercola sp. PAMC28395]|nr:HigA family addiction module antidote protein [Subtercola sp. PAMC28395]
MDEIVHGKRAITPNTASRLSNALGTSDRFWMNLQSRYDLDVAIAEHRMFAWICSRRATR